MDVEKIREALNHGEKVYGNLIDVISGARGLHDLFIEALEDLSTIDPEAIRRECADTACKALDVIDRHMLALGKTTMTSRGKLKPPEMQIDKAKSYMTSAILSAEPAQDDGKAKIKSGNKCPACGAFEVDAMTPHTVYACGSCDYGQRPGTFHQSTECAASVKRRLEEWKA